MNKLVSLVVFTVLAACKSGDGGSDLPASIITTQPPSNNQTTEPVTDGGTAGNNPFPWNRFFVTEFDQTKVQAVRDLPGFLANNLNFNLRLAGHPTFGGDGKRVRSNPLSAARLDYALSTGLTGVGQIVSMIDEGIRLSHEQFAGKTIYTSGSPSPSGDFHGTAVASVMAGAGVNGETLGFAPAADIHQGYLNFEASVTWTELGSHMRDAAALGAIVSNNSWGVPSTVRDQDVVAYFRSAQRRPYVDSLRSFATDGVIVFALQNDFFAESASVIAAMPLGVPELEANWISVVNAIPEFDDDRIHSAERLSAACLETARFCMTANGVVKVATATSDTGYEIGIGASFAAPQVAGSIALLAEAFPDLTASQLRDRLLATADNGFFVHSGALTFAPGITHGYNEEFGHGFLDLRSALLPIGQAEVAMANGQSIDLGTSAITAGSATGDGLARALSAMTIQSTDQLYGSFTVSADVLADIGTRVEPAVTAMSVATNPNVAAERSALNTAIRTGTQLTGHRGAWADPTGADMLGGSFIPLGATDNGFGVAFLTGDGTTGVSLQQTFDLSSSNLQLGFATMRTDGSIMGVSVPSAMGEVTSLTNSLQIEFASKIATNTAIRFNAETGFANGGGAGMVSGFDTISYNRVGFAVERANISQDGDILTMFARRPLGITNGSAEIELPVQFSNGVTTFETNKVSLAPVERQFDIGFEYSTPISRNGNLSLGMLHSANDGNSLRRQAMSGFVGLQFSF